MEFKVFDKWETNRIAVNDIGIKPYLNLENPSLHSFSRHANKPFGKTKYNVIERFVKKIMVTGHLKDNRVHKRVSGRDTGKKQRVSGTLKKSFEIIEKKTKKNPVQVFVEAVENTAPKEETTRLRQGGIIVHKAVDVSPQRRLDVALRLLSHGAGQRCFDKKANLENSLAEEILAAANNDQKAYSISKKDEYERVAESAR